MEHINNIEATIATEMGKPSLLLSREDFLAEVAFKVGLDGVLGFQRRRQ